LTELLIVIGIIALLIGILLPALNRARDAAATVKCMSNLRQIGLAYQLYRNANKNWMPPGLIQKIALPVTDPNFQSRFDFFPADPGVAPLTWADGLINGKFATRDVFDCPSVDSTALVGGLGTKRTERGLEYSINGLIQWNFGRLIGIRDIDESEESINGQWSAFDAWPYKLIRRQSEGMLVMDNALPRRSIYYIFPNDPNMTPGRLRHASRKKVNMLFFDGHVETREPARLSIARADVIFDNGSYCPGLDNGSVFTNESALLTQPSPLWRPWQPYFRGY